jgi:hypothetical protein
MSDHLREQVPILKDFTRFFGRLAEDFLGNAKPSQSDFDWQSIAKTAILGSKKKGYTLPPQINALLGIKPGTPLSEATLKRFGFWKPNGTLSELIYGVAAPDDRRTGGKYLKVEIADMVKLNELEVFYANKLPKSWTNVPWVNFDGKVIEQNFTQQFEERLVFRISGKDTFQSFNFCLRYKTTINIKITNWFNFGCISHFHSSNNRGF